MRETPAALMCTGAPRRILYTMRCVMLYKIITATSNGSVSSEALLGTRSAPAQAHRDAHAVPAPPRHSRAGARKAALLIAAAPARAAARAEEHEDPEEDCGAGEPRQEGDARPREPTIQVIKLVAVLVRWA